MMIMMRGRTEIEQVDGFLQQVNWGVGLRLNFRGGGRKGWGKESQNNILIRCEYIECVCVSKNVYD